MVARLVVVVVSGHSKVLRGLAAILDGQSGDQVVQVVTLALGHNVAIRQMANLAGETESIVQVSAETAYGRRTGWCHGAQWRVGDETGAELALTSSPLDTIQVDVDSGGQRQVDHGHDECGQEDDDACAVALGRAEWAITVSGTAICLLSQYFCFVCRL